MTVKEIIEAYLKEHGYDGLYYPGECACKIGDLASCDNLNLECQPGYITTFPNGAMCSCGQGCTFHIGPDKSPTQDGPNDH